MPENVHPAYHTCRSRREWREFGGEPRFFIVILLRDTEALVEPHVNRTDEQRRRDALAIWLAGVDAVRSDRLVREQVRVEDRWLEIADRRFDLTAIRRIVVVGAGKAGAGMAAGFEAALGPRWLAEKQVSGWINVPENCVRPLERIHLHAARAAGVNEPSPQGVLGSEQILRLVESLSADDLCVTLISGGGSALLPLPTGEITLDDKLAVTRYLSAAGANIEELNAVRKQLSVIKGGGLARACRAGELVALVISDVLGDPLDLIASGPTVESDPSPARALEVLERYKARAGGISERVYRTLETLREPQRTATCTVTNSVIGNNGTAVAAATEKAVQLGYATESTWAERPEGSAEDIGCGLADHARVMRHRPGHNCLVSGGEPTVKLAPAERRGLGGRNQQLVLAAAERLTTKVAGILILSGGTDGEDGPTDAAGAFVDETMLDEAVRRGLACGDYLRRNDAYHWFEPLGGLMKTGPTDTNVCDVRVVLVDGGEAGAEH
jgi:glycerate 2-kinase